MLYLLRVICSYSKYAKVRVVQIGVNGDIHLFFSPSKQAAIYKFTYNSKTEYVLYVVWQSVDKVEQN